MTDLGSPELTRSLVEYSCVFQLDYGVFEKSGLNEKAPFGLDYLQVRFLLS